MQRGTRLLENLLAHTAFEAAKSARASEPSELLVFNLLNERDTLAGEWLHATLGQRKTEELRALIEQRSLLVPSTPGIDHTKLFTTLRRQLFDRFQGEPTLTTCHLLRWIMEQPAYVAALLHRFGVTATRVEQAQHTVTRAGVSSHFSATEQFVHDLDALFQRKPCSERVNLNPFIR